MAQLHVCVYFFQLSAVALGTYWRRFTCTHLPVGGRFALALAGERLEDLDGRKTAISRGQTLTGK